MGGAQHDATRRLLEQADADLGAIAAAVEQITDKREPREGPMPLAPAAKRALLDARQIARATGASYIGPHPLVLAREGRIDPVIGRDDEIAQTIEVLSRRTKNNPALLDEPGSARPRSWRVARGRVFPGREHVIEEAAYLRATRV